MVIYIDSEFKCYTMPAEERRSVETDFFDGKCKQYIEGHYFVPKGEKWVSPNGFFYRGEMVTAWKDSTLLDEFQALYEEEQVKATAEIAAIVEEVYNSDMEVIANV